jgi:hypothetical protein
VETKNTKTSLMKKFLFYFAIAGWMLGLTIHLISIANIDVEEYMPYVWILHIGIFVVWFPTILSLRNNEDFIEYQQSGWLNRMNPFAFFKVIFERTPTWLSILSIGCFVYGLLNFIWLMRLHIETAVIYDNQYYLKRHDQLIREISELEYHIIRALKVRLFSGHWIAFYGFAAGVIFPFKERREEEKDFKESAIKDADKRKLLTLYHKNLKIAMVTQKDFEFPNFFGEFTLFEFDKQTQENLLIKNYIEYSIKESSLLEDSEEEWLKFFEEEEAKFEVLIDSEDWYFINESGEKIKILTPTFRAGNELMWR